MMRDDTCGQFVLKGEKVAQDHRVTDLPVDLMALARENNIEIMPKPDGLAPGVSGMLIRRNKDFIINYAVHIDNIGFQRFSIAHELGHYFLPGHSDAVFVEGNKHESRAGFISDNRYEREADCFATGILMPRTLFKKAMSGIGEGLLAIERLSDQCQTSLTATSIRFVKLSDAAMAIVLSTKDRVNSCFMSDRLKSLDGIEWIRKNDPLPKNTATFTFNQDADRIGRADDVSDLQDWFGGHRSLEINEKVVGLGRYGKTLTVLTVPDLPDLDEIEEEDRLVESWNPRF